MTDEVTLIDDTGVERRFKLHDAFELDETTYYLVEDAGDAERVLLLRETDAGLETVDGEEFAHVMKALEEDTVD